VLRSAAIAAIKPLETIRKPLRNFPGGRNLETVHALKSLAKTMASRVDCLVDERRFQISP
jgi:hypothetical protein